jgi:Flp pilus assembly protein TadD
MKSFNTASLRTSRPTSLSTAVLAAALLSLPAAFVQAADTPTVSAPSVSDRLGNARQHIEAKRWSAALAELRLALRDEPRNADVHNLLGYSYRKQARPDLPKAFEHYKTALELNPGHKGAHEYIGEAYLMDKKPAEAAKHLATLEKLCGNKTCEEYQDLAQALAKYKAANP